MQSFTSYFINFRRSTLVSAGLGFLMLAALVIGVQQAVLREGPASPTHSLRFPTIDPTHEHARALAGNAIRYVSPENGIIDPHSGYPREGWNHDPQQQLFLRSFTQLTAIGLWLEVLGNAVAGYADAPGLHREEAIAHLTKAVGTLRKDQHDPRLSAKGLMVNFLDLGNGTRAGPLSPSVDKQRILDGFGPVKGEVVWRRLIDRGWIAPYPNGLEADVRRGPGYGWNFFDGPLDVYRDDDTKHKLMEILDQRVVLIVFGDNANLSTSVAKTIGALTRAPDADDPPLVTLREELERFLADQEQGYQHLYDSQAGLFYFGWNATRDRFIGWHDGEGKWRTGHMDYMVNEFRLPTAFVVARHHLPVEALANLGFKIKPYRLAERGTAHVLAPWEGSAFQAIGLSASAADLRTPSWRHLLHSMIDVQIDFATRRSLPGFLSESYTGNGVQYTGYVGIPAITVSSTPRITDAPSLYTLGVAYTLAPRRIELFLGEHWPTISTLLTDHGPWEGYNVSQQEPIAFQTSAHTFSLLLGLLGTAPENLHRYLDSRGLADRFAEFFQEGAAVDLLTESTQTFAWADIPDAVETSRRGTRFDVKTGAVTRLGVALVTPGERGADLAGGQMTLRYRAGQALSGVSLAMKTVGQPPDSSLIPKEVLLNLEATGDGEREVSFVLPAMPGLRSIKEIVFSYEARSPESLEFSLLGLSSRPLPPAG